MEPDTPLTVTATCPVVAVALAFTVIVLVVVAGFGEKDADTPAGKPGAEGVTVPLKPFCGVMVMVIVALSPWSTVRVGLESERVKSPCWLLDELPPHPT